MRARPFLEFLDKYYNPHTAANLANRDDIRGGWEVWLQVEIALCFCQREGRICTRERPYGVPGRQGDYFTLAGGITPNLNAAARCDFHLARQYGQTDETYVELKCINPFLPNAQVDAWNRYHQDIAKLRALDDAAGPNFVIPYIALLAIFGHFTAEDLKNIECNYPRLFVWDPGKHQVTRVQEVSQDVANRFFLLACSH